MKIQAITNGRAVPPTGRLDRSLSAVLAIVRNAAIATLVMTILARPTVAFEQQLQPFFALYCNDCHSGGEAEGGLRLDELRADLDDLANFAKWERIFDRVQQSEMPPKDAGQPDAKHRETFISALQTRLSDSHAGRKGTVLRRLNRREYQNTMNDLFGTNLDLESQFPADGRAHEFDNVGASLNISMVQLQQYLDAVDSVMDAAIAQTTAPPKSTKKRANYAETREGKEHIGKSWGQADDGAVVFFRPLGYPTGMLRTANIRETGRYRIRVTGYAYQSADPITFSVGGTTFQRGAPRPTFGYFEFPPGTPTTIELEAWIEKNYMVDIAPWGISDNDNEIRKKGIAAYTGPGLAINQVELEGPLVGPFPSRGHQLIFDGLNRREIEPSNPSVRSKSWYRPKFELAAADLPDRVATALARIAGTAFRRPVPPSEVDQYVSLFNTQASEGASPEEALRTAVAAIFCSPDFLYLREPPGWLDDYAIAARLSYFLTRTTPDAPLLAAAASGKLTTNREVLLAHTRRLLDDPRSERFVIDFTDAWLNLRDIEFTSPDQTLFPEYDPFLHYSMLQETRQFFATLIHDNARVRHLVASDFSMLNNRLALHYGIAGVRGPALQRVALPADSLRGGLLSQASVLKVSANGTNTSPVVRGVWVMERILGQSPVPPPPGVPGVEPDIRGAATLRELLAKHRDSENCRSCHAVIDPPGFALECFNPIGGWRDHFRSLGAGEKVDLLVNGRKVRYRVGPAVDSSGELPDGKAFAGFHEYRSLLAQEEDVLVRAMATKLLTFATGREMGFSDRPMLERIVRDLPAQEHGLRDLIELVVLSEAFRRK